jgi:hypothetical protein
MSHTLVSDDIRQQSTNKARIHVQLTGTLTKTVMATGSLAYDNTNCIGIRIKPQSPDAPQPLPRHSAPTRNEEI